jgi:hypothetical protein
MRCMKIAICDAADMLNASQISALLARPIVWAWRRVSSGVYGVPVRRGGRAVWVPIRAVEAHHGLRFTREQLAAVGVEIVQTEGVEDVAA